MDSSDYMKLAINEAMKNVTSGSGGPFGACIVKDGQVIALARNSVLLNHNPTQHAEINAITEATEKLGNHLLNGATIYSTTEPCPMCFSAIHWAKIDHIVFGTRIADVAALGFNELNISNQTMKDCGGSPVTIEADVERDACLELLRQWHARQAGSTY